MMTRRVKRIGKSDIYKIETLEEVSEDDGMRVELWTTEVITPKDDPCQKCPHRKS